jgi:phosphatidylglycerophosphate synthase
MLLGLSPNAVTLLGSVVGLAAAVTVVRGPQRPSHWAVGFVLWWIAYALDCADGQLARVSRHFSPIGSQLDLLADATTRTGVAVAVASSVSWSTALFAASVGSWLTVLVVSGALTSASDARPSGGLRVAARLAMDYPLQLAALCAAGGLGPRALGATWGTLTCLSAGYAVAVLWLRRQQPITE